MQVLSTKDVLLSSILDSLEDKFPISGEININVDKDVDSKIKKVVEFYSPKAEVSTIDGWSFDMGNVRFNIRKSNTEPLIRLNCEAVNDSSLVKNTVKNVLNLLR